MNALLYLTKKTFVNKLKKAIRKPSALIFILFWIVYGIFILNTFSSMAVDMKLNSIEGLVVILSYLIMMTLPANVISYVRKKGIIFNVSDIHFLFNTPLSPKMILVYRFLKTLFPSLIMNAILAIGSISLFNVPTSQVIVFCLYMFVFEPLFEAGMMLNIYANEKLTEKHQQYIRYFAWGSILLFVLSAAYTAVFIEPSFSALGLFPLQEFILWIPVFGWAIAIYHLIFLGPTLINIICSLLFVVTVIGLLLNAYKMECTGKYFEEAADYAKEFSERRKKAKKGEVSYGKKKYKKASIAYKGNYAQAIFYRQVLEYKKNRFFIFGGATIIALGTGIVVAFFSYMEQPPVSIGLFILPGLSAYFSLLMSGYATKWGKEIQKSYTFLIPDTPMRKLWYATLIEHIRALVDALLMVIPAGIFIGLNIFQMLICVFVHVSVNAIKLYTQVICQSILGKSLGATGLSMLKMLFQSLILVGGIIIAFVVSLTVSFEMGLISVGLYGILCSLLLMLASTRLFDKYETLD